jgi:hypothetical protein
LKYTGIKANSRASNLELLIKVSVRPPLNVPKRDAVPEAIVVDVLKQVMYAAVSRSKYLSGYSD